MGHLPISHRTPRRPGGHMHQNPPIPSLQVAPPKHGCGEHSLTLIRQSGPENPLAHRQRNQPGPDSQIPPLWHGWPWHWSTGLEQNEPPHPVEHRHCATPASNKQEPPFRHCPGAHWVIRSVQSLPIYWITKQSFMSVSWRTVNLIIWIRRPRIIVSCQRSVQSVNYYTRFPVVHVLFILCIWICAIWTWMTI